MTSKLVVNTIEADTGISSVSFASSISMSSTSVFHFSDAGVNIGADTNIGRAGNGILAFNINSSEKARIDSSGRLIIGTTTQGTAGADELTLSTGGSTGITIRSGSSNDGNLFFSMGTGGTETYKGFIQYEHSNNAFRFGTNATERVRIKQSGEVQIGAVDQNANRGASSIKAANDDGGTGINVYLQEVSGSEGYGLGVDSDGDLNFYNSGATTPTLEILDNNDVEITDGNLVIGTSGHGIDFSATPNGYSGSINETLDDYEEGYFTPTVGGWSASGTGVYGSGGQIGRYTKIGNTVTIFFHVYWTSLNNASGVFAIENLPFAHSSGTYNLSTAVQMRYVDYDGDTVFAIGGNGYSSSLLFYAQNDNGNHNYVAVDSNGGRIEGCVTYLTDS